MTDLKMIKIQSIPQNSVQSRMGVLSSTESKVVHLLNSYNLALANRNGDYFNILAKSEYNFVDGKLLQISLSKLFQIKIFQIRGIDLMKSILSAPPNGIVHLFICPNNDNSFQLKNVLEQFYPRLESEFLVPPVTNDIKYLSNEILNKMSSRRFDYIWIGVGTPKQDFLAQELRKTKKGAYIICVGAALDFLAGTKKEAPKVIQNMGLEWLFRFCQEPRRLFKRYFIKSWGFFFIILRKKIVIESS